MRTRLSKHATLPPVYQTYSNYHPGTTGSKSYLLLKLRGVCSPLPNAEGSRLTHQIRFERSKKHTHGDDSWCVFFQAQKWWLCPVGALSPADWSLLSCKRALFRTESRGPCFLIRWLCFPIYRSAGSDQILCVNHLPWSCCAERWRPTFLFSSIALLQAPSMTKRGWEDTAFMLPPLHLVEYRKVLFLGYCYHVTTPLYAKIFLANCYNQIFF